MTNRTTFLFAIIAATGLTACGSSEPSDSAATTSENKATEVTGKPTAPAVQSEAGTVQTTLNGEPTRWQVDSRQSDWFGGLDSPLTSVSFLSSVHADASVPGRISFTLTRNANGWISSGIKIVPTVSGPVYSSNDGAAEVVVTSAVMDGDILKLSGTFSGTLPYREYTSPEADMNKVLNLQDGTFEVNIPPRQ